MIVNINVLMTILTFQFSCYYICILFYGRQRFIICIIMIIKCFFSKLNNDCSKTSKLNNELMTNIASLIFCLVVKIILFLTVTFVYVYKFHL